MAGKYVYPMARQFFVRAVFVSTRAISRFARRCSLSPAASAVSGFPGVGALTRKPCSSKSFRRDPVRHQRDRKNESVALRSGKQFCQVFLKIVKPGCIFTKDLFLGPL